MTTTSATDSDPAEDGSGSEVRRSRDGPKTKQEKSGNDHARDDDDDDVASGPAFRLDVPNIFCRRSLPSFARIFPSEDSSETGTWRQRDSLPPRRSVHNPWSFKTIGIGSTPDP